MNKDLNNVYDKFNDMNKISLDVCKLIGKEDYELLVHGIYSNEEQKYIAAKVQEDGYNAKLLFEDKSTPQPLIQYASYEYDLRKYNILLNALNNDEINVFVLKDVFRIYEKSIKNLFIKNDLYCENIGDDLVIYNKSQSILLLNPDKQIVPAHMVKYNKQYYTAWCKFQAEYSNIINNINTAKYTKIQVKREYMGSMRYIEKRLKELGYDAYIVVDFPLTICIREDSI